MLSELKPINLCVTGNMASGKTTFARFLAQLLDNACLVQEPVEANPFLPLYLADQRRWGFTAQLRYFADYVQTFEQATASKHHNYHLIDAGIWTNQMVYTQYLRDKQIITDEEYAFYQRMCNDILHAHPVPEADAFIFIDASPLICWQRMHQRGWSYQVASVELDYIDTLGQYFTQMKATIQQKSIPTLTLSSEEIDYTSIDGQHEALRRIEGFLDSHHLAHPR